MKKSIILFTATLILPLSAGMAQADQPLTRAEILEIFQILTNKPQKTWIPAGTIEATRQEYGAPQTTDENEISAQITRALQEYRENLCKPELTEELQQQKIEAIPFNVRYRLANEYLMDSQVKVHYDGERFYWEITVTDRTDSVSVPGYLSGNPRLEFFDLPWNQKRIFCWDGQKYITYFLPGNHAIITAQAGRVNGPLTAGLPFWGCGPYRYEKLIAYPSSAYTTNTNSTTEIHLELTVGQKQESLVLAPAMNYALKSWTTLAIDSAKKTIRSYDNYIGAGDSWCPTDITLDTFDLSQNTPAKIARDHWHFTSIYTTIPGPEQFTVTYEYDALIEDYCFGTPPLLYRYSVPGQSLSNKGVDSEVLLAYKILWADGSYQDCPNCGWLAVQYLASQLGQESTGKELCGGLRYSREEISLSQLQQLLAQKHLYSLAVKTDTPSLRQYQGLGAILYLPDQNHFVVLGSVDQQYVRFIDLASQYFYVRQKLCQFASRWDGIALLVDKQPISASTDLVLLDATRLNEITGGACGSQCNKDLQDSSDSACSQPGCGSCTGSHTIVYARKGCGPATSGTCTESSMIASQSETCVPDPNDPNNSICIGNGEWSSSSISACQ